MSFGADLDRFAKMLNKSFDQIVYEITYEWFASTIMTSPVGDPENWKRPNSAPAGYVGGRFRGNWHPSVGSPSDKVLAGVRPEAATLGALRSEIPSKAGSLVYLANNLPYGERLEYDGWSSQAPSGMVRVNLARIQGIVSKAVRKHKV